MKIESNKAASATTIYNDVYMRKYLGDTGKIPESGSWTWSPDIVPTGKALIQNPVKTLTETYDSDIGKPTSLANQNYFYVRGKNLSPDPQTATFELYYCPAHLFLFPSLWMENQLLTSDGKKQVSASALAANDIIVPDQPFTYVPVSEEHHCLIGRVITDKHPNPLPDNITDMNALSEYILNNPNMSWRNVVLIKEDIPTFTHYFDLDVGDADCRVLLGLRCNNLTVGSSVAFSCGTPIPSGPDKGKTIELVKTEVTQPDIFLGQEEFNFPAGYKSNVSYSYWAKAPIQGGWKVIFEAIQIFEPDHPLYSRAKCFTELGYPERRLGADGGLHKGIIVGQCSTNGK
ncbi:MAG: hypothetical protein NHB15_02880 [Methanosarcina barkeri]|nr:hypothetical protein [Methanosarcina sp. ERenArc_MAG2]